MSEPKFKVGDKVKVVEGGWGVSSNDLGKTTEIVRVIPNGSGYRYEFCTRDFEYDYGGDTYKADERSFELVGGKLCVPNFKIEYNPSADIHNITVHGKLSQDTIMAIYKAIHENRVA